MPKTSSGAEKRAADAAAVAATDKSKFDQPPQKKHKKDTRLYLDMTVTPLLFEALTELAEIRPDDPVQYLAQYLLDNKHRVLRPNGEDDETGNK
ncbi:hypothetical protein SARC_08237 [Sphaeroforma arctica JP610]|uniref:RIIa domain-containing protein n=1 Tax=Sphaeroforma arctica JP610 TaxID=667725 RepID=A0A0L0FTX5_9EUKA|nr:hypothetical protein SARC_08237 [Sphaeroforma arctica JP610]KNC79373.1 hypothetical protein SARC_08237 [Sphaeroforma arctica JP610]|eukprot:XP_014153275.1 hypothetical protein SARC_08237 [Sphaeroforma arctica JP610]